jgi:hypothetical protein
MYIWPFIFWPVLFAQLAKRGDTKPRSTTLSVLRRLNKPRRKLEQKMAQDDCTDQTLLSVISRWFIYYAKQTVMTVMPSLPTKTLETYLVDTRLLWKVCCRELYSTNPRLNFIIRRSRLRRGEAKCEISVGGTRRYLVLPKLEFTNMWICKTNIYVTINFGWWKLNINPYLAIIMPHSDCGRT